MEEQPLEVSFKKRCSLKKGETPVPESLFNKESLIQVFSCEFCEIFKNTFFTEHLRTTASEYLGVRESKYFDGG